MCTCVHIVVIGFDRHTKFRFALSERKWWLSSSLSAYQSQYWLLMNRTWLEHTHTLCWVRIYRKHVVWIIIDRCDLNKFDSLSGHHLIKKKCEQNRNTATIPIEHIPFIWHWTVWRSIFKLFCEVSFTYCNVNKTCLIFNRDYDTMKHVILFTADVFSVCLVFFESCVYLVDMCWVSEFPANRRPAKKNLQRKNYSRYRLSLKG